MYKFTDKMCDLMSHEEDAIQIISRFGLEMGVGEQTIAEVCESHGVHTPTFLAIQDRLLDIEKTDNKKGSHTSVYYSYHNNNTEGKDQTQNTDLPNTYT